MNFSNFDVVAEKPFFEKNLNMQDIRDIKISKAIITKLFNIITTIGLLFITGPMIATIIRDLLIENNFIPAIFYK